MLNRQLKPTNVAILLSMAGLLSGCLHPEDSNSKEPECDVVANPNEDSFLKVINRLENGLAWIFSDGSYSFGADMRPDECTIFGLNPGTYSVTFQQCNISRDDGCTSTIGNPKEVMFTTATGQTHTIEVDASFFNK